MFTATESELAVAEVFLKLARRAAWTLIAYLEPVP